MMLYSNEYDAIPICRTHARILCVHTLRFITLTKLMKFNAEQGKRPIFEKACAYVLHSYNNNCIF